MKMILLFLSALSSAALAEQLPLLQPTRYQIQIPAVPFTGEEVLSQPAAAPAAPVQQYLSPDVTAAAAAPVAPAQQYLSPDVTAVAAAPAVPVQQYLSPDVTAAAAAPVAPVQQYLSPAVTAAASAPAVPSQIYQEPSTAAAASPAAGYLAPEPEAPAQYDFAYSVNAYDHSGNKVDYGHSEKREGSYTTGSYYVLLPDTRLMKVDYYVDDWGFHPTYTYEGEAVYPDASASAVRPQTAAAPSQLYSQPGRK